MFFFQFFRFWKISIFFSSSILRRKAVYIGLYSGDLRVILLKSALDQSEKEKTEIIIR